MVPNLHDCGWVASLSSLWKEWFQSCPSGPLWKSKEMTITVSVSSETQEMLPQHPLSCLIFGLPFSTLLKEAPQSWASNSKVIDVAGKEESSSARCLRVASSHLCWTPWAAGGWRVWGDLAWPPHEIDIKIQAVMSWWRQEKVLSINKHKRNANQNHNETSHHPSKRQKINAERIWR